MAPLHRIAAVLGLLLATRGIALAHPIGQIDESASSGLRANRRWKQLDDRESEQPIPTALSSDGARHVKPEAKF